MFNKTILSISLLASSLALAQTSQTPTTPPAAVENYVLRVDHMMCGSCTSRVKKVIQAQPGTSDVQVNLTDQEARFSCKKDKGCDVDKITKNLSKIGYPARIDTSKK